MDWLPCRMQFLPPRILLEACLYCMALECCLQEPYSWILPCHYKDASRTREQLLEDAYTAESNSMHGMSLVVVVFLVEELILYAELLGVAGLRVEAHCSSCRNVETPLYSVLEDRLKNLSLDLLNNSVHRIIDLSRMTGSHWIRQYVLLAEEIQIQPLFWHHVSLLGSTNPCRITQAK